MKSIASTDFYSIDVDQLKNRMVLTYKGSWIRPDQVPNFLEDHAAAVRLLSKGFTVLADVRQMEGMFLSDYVEKVQKHALEAGIRKAARVYPGPSFIRVQADRIHERTGIRSKAFESMEEAEAWLDEP